MKTFLEYLICSAIGVLLVAICSAIGALLAAICVFVPMLIGW